MYLSKFCLSLCARIVVTRANECTWSLASVLRHRSTRMLHLRLATFLIFISTIKRFTLEQPQGERKVRFTANLVVAYNKKWRKPIYVTTMVSFSRTMFGTRSHTRSLTITQQQVNHHRICIEYIYRYIILVIPPPPPPSFWDGSQTLSSMVEY